MSEWGTDQESVPSGQRCLVDLHLISKNREHLLVSWFCVKETHVLISERGLKIIVTNIAWSSGIASDIDYSKPLIIIILQNRRLKSSDP